MSANDNAVGRGSDQARVTLADVAERAGVDRSVASRVWNEDPRLNIRQETRERVMHAFAELGYRPHAIARSLRTSQTGVIGLLIPDFSNPIYAQIIRGAEVAAAERGFALLTGSRVGGALGIERYHELLGGQRIDALLLAGAEDAREVQTLLRNTNIPWLMLNRRASQQGRYLILDDEGAAVLAVRHLLELGHRAIGHIAGPPVADTARRRSAGYVRALRSAGIRPVEDFQVQTDYTPAGGAQAMAALLARKQRPTAIFVANVASAIGAAHAAKRAGLVLPRDLSIVAIHDLPLAEYLDPPLTTVRMPLEALGRRGVELLADGPSSRIEETIRGPMELILRASATEPRRNEEA
jgi:LacI family transcriptional regulator